VLLLPYLEANDLYSQFRLSEPWNSSHNLALLPRMPKVFATPADMPVGMQAEPFTTFYQVFVGKGTAFEGSPGLRLPAAKTGLIFEAGSAVPWTKPIDLAYEVDQPLPDLGGVFTGRSRFSLFGSNRIKGFHIGFTEGYVRFVSPEVSEATLRAVITGNHAGLADLDR